MSPTITACPAKLNTLTYDADFSAIFSAFDQNQQKHRKTTFPFGSFAVVGQSRACEKRGLSRYWSSVYSWISPVLIARSLHRRNSSAGVLSWRFGQRVHTALQTSTPVITAPYTTQARIMSVVKHPPNGSRTRSAEISVSISHRAQQHQGTRPTRKAR